MAPIIGGLAQVCNKSRSVGLLLLFAGETNYLELIVAKEPKLLAPTLLSPQASFNAGSAGWLKGGVASWQALLELFNLLGSLHCSCLLPVQAPFMPILYPSNELVLLVEVVN